MAAGAIDTLLKLIGSISRSIADQEVLRHTFSTFRNLTRHPHLTEALIETNGSSQAILLEFIRSVDMFLDNFFYSLTRFLSWFVLNSFLLLAAETKKRHTSLQLMFYKTYVHSRKVLKDYAVCLL